MDIEIVAADLNKNVGPLGFEYMVNGQRAAFVMSNYERDAWVCYAYDFRFYTADNQGRTMVKVATDGTESAARDAAMIWAMVSPLNA